MHMWHSSWRHFTPPCGLVGALAVHEAQVAVGALRVILLHAEEREPGENAEERAERAENAAPEARDESVREEDRDEQKDDEPRLVKIELLRLPDGLREEVLRVIGRRLERARMNVLRRAQSRARVRYCAAGMTPRPIERTAMQIGIEEPADRAPGEPRDEERVEQVVLRALVGVRLVRLDAVPAAPVRATAGASRRSGGACRTGRSSRRTRDRRRA